MIERKQNMEKVILYVFLFLLIFVSGCHTMTDMQKKQLTDSVETLAISADKVRRPIKGEVQKGKKELSYYTVYELRQSFMSTLDLFLTKKERIERWKEIEKKLTPIEGFNPEKKKDVK